MVVYPPHSLNHIIFKNNYKKIFLSQLIVVSLYLKLYNIRIMNKDSMEVVKLTINSIPVYRRYKNSNWEYRIFEDKLDGNVLHINGDLLDINKHKIILYDFIIDIILNTDNIEVLMETTYLEIIN